MLSNVKKKDVPLIAISLAAIVFIAATLSLFPQQTAQAADSIFNGVTRLLGSTVQVLVLLALACYVGYVFLTYYRVEDNLPLEVEKTSTESDPAM